MHSSRKPRICDVLGCSERVEARAMCSRHYNQQRRGVLLERRGESTPRMSEPWTYENPDGEQQLIAKYDEGSNTNV
jgi:hypothetical protein